MQKNIIKLVKSKAGVFTVSLACTSAIKCDTKREFAFRIRLIKKNNIIKQNAGIV